jgi:manganese transport protein
MILQEMAARVGLVTRKGLSDAIREGFSQPLLRALVLGLVAVAITLGNAAYEAGNLLGASLGLEILTGWPPRVWAGILAVCAAGLLASGTYRVIQRALVGLVVVMSLVFIVTAFLVRPALPAVLKGIFVPTIPEGSLLIVIALIGTTVVPYNLFLHASIVQEKWSKAVSAKQALSESRMDTVFAVALGGVVTLAVVINATPLFVKGLEVSNPALVATQLEPILGGSAKSFFGLGLFAAGLTSAITAPLGAAYATTGAMGWDCNLKSPRFRAVWAFVVATGAVTSFVGGSPTQIIVLAQAANGLLLPLIAVFLLVVVNKSKLMGEFKNGWLANLLGAMVVLIVSGLGLYQLLRVFGVIGR